MWGLTGWLAGLRKGVGVGVLSSIPELPGTGKTRGYSLHAEFL